MQLQANGKGQWYQYIIRLDAATPNMLSMTQNVGDGKGFGDRTVDIRRCETSQPKTQRQGHDHALRLDLSPQYPPDSGITKYVISFSNAEKLKAFQKAFSGPKIVAWYKAVAKGRIRAGVEFDSRDLGEFLKAGDIIEVTRQSQESETGIMRVKFDRGWASVTSREEKPLLEEITHDAMYASPCWIADGIITGCMICEANTDSPSTKFSQDLEAKHCRRCGFVVCGKCARNKRVINPYLDTTGKHALRTGASPKELRVCDHCHKNEDEG